MAECLLVLESPAKAKTLKEYLGKRFDVRASYGHVRDLPAKTGSVDPDHQFRIKYQLIEKNAKHVDELIRALEKAKTIYLATDPDREGEAIAWHIQQILEEKGLLKGKTLHRVVFHEITRSAVQAGIDNPRDISMNLVNAQQTRRALDYLVGFNLSPQLWKKVRRGLSAGRVQSPALRLIAEREEEIERFVSQEYWTLTAQLHPAQPFSAKLHTYQGKKLEMFSVTEESQAKSIQKELHQKANGTLVVHDLKAKQRRRTPAAPFITSTLQQDAVRKLGFSAQKTMRTAQQLYEGMAIGGSAVGLISYMRTDSTQLSQDALSQIRQFVSERYGNDLLPKEAQVYKTKSKNAQEAHEAIRPTDVYRTPEELKPFLDRDQWRLYDLIWKRTVACQMNAAVYDVASVDLLCGEGNVFHATGSVLKEPGFLTVYQEGEEEGAAAEGDKILPPMKVGDKISLQEIVTQQHFTEPPPRFSEANLIKALEEFGIGRPSTYASIIATLISRDYAVLEQKRFKPTELGRIVNKFLTNHFPRYVDYEFTAQLEDDLDAVARGEKEWLKTLDDFWHPFKKQLDVVGETVSRKDVTQEALDEACPKCSKPLSSRFGRNGRFIGCTGYPECDYTRNLTEQGEGAQQDQVLVEGRSCPQCNHPLNIRFGRYGKFIGCSHYPECKYIESLNKPESTGIQCPECQKGDLLKRRSRRGTFFYSCAHYPKCKYAVWNTPEKVPCEKCHWPITTIKTTKRKGTERVCPQEQCKHTVPCEES